MSEAAKDGDNPFSFKKFMKRSSVDVGGLLEQKEKEGGNTSRRKKEARSNSSAAADVLFPEVEETQKGVKQL